MFADMGRVVSLIEKGGGGGGGLMKGDLQTRGLINKDSILKGKAY